MDNEPSQKVKFTPFQGETGKTILSHFGKDLSFVDTIYFLEEGKLLEKSTAVLRLSRYLNRPWNWAYAFIAVPRPIRDLFYGWVAKNRYRFFGKKDACRIPSAAEKARFLT